jgi:hypothetical protein
MGDEMTNWPADKIKRGGYVRDRVCDVCSTVSVVRKDNKSTTCKSCSAKITGAKGIAVIKANAKKKPCATCGKDMPSSLNWENCSLDCKKKSTRINRECKHCKNTFEIRKSALKTNASGNFCSRDCYNNWMCRTERKTGRGSRWNAIRKEAIKRQPFCGLCGTTRGLQVHHITPFRLTHDNSQSNLVPLCVKHHKVVENLFLSTEEFGINKETEFVWRSMIAENVAATRMKLREIINEIQN